MVNIKDQICVILVKHVVKETVVLLAAASNNAPFRSCISKIGNTLMGKAEDLDKVMPIYNLLE